MTDLRSETRLLSKDELALVEKTHNPTLAELSDGELSKIHKLLRDRRDKARGIADRQKREMRGKADPKGARPAGDNTGTHSKRDVLAEALSRLNEELKRREQKSSRHTLIDNAKRALEMRRASKIKTTPAPPGSAVPSAKSKAKKAQTTDGAPKNPAKAGAVSQHTKNMQAKKDGR
jgi:hypothetical protein